MLGEKYVIADPFSWIIDANADLQSFVLNYHYDLYQ